MTPATRLTPGMASGPILHATEGLSFWGGVDPDSGTIIDTHHPCHGQTVAGHILVMPSSRGSCSGSGILLQLALSGLAPAALIFCEPEDILTLGAVVAGLMFDTPIPVLHLPPAAHKALTREPEARITATHLTASNLHLPLSDLPKDTLRLSPQDQAWLDGAEGPALQRAMQGLTTMARIQGAEQLMDVTRAHIDGCIYASPASLRFAQTMARMGARVAIPTTTNAISVDMRNWRAQGVPALFGTPAEELARAYVTMGAAPSYTCAPYHSADAPGQGEAIGWSESNAVIYANSVLGARSVKHPDFLDLFIALTGRAPRAGVYLAENRIPQLEITIEIPAGADDALWPLLGWCVGKRAPDSIPRLTGLESTRPTDDDLRALCAAFGTTSAAPLLHVAGITPEGHLAAPADAPRLRITRADLAAAWEGFNTGPAAIDLVALGSPHFSLAELHRFAALMDGKHCHANTACIITLGRETLAAAADLIPALTAAGVQLVPDICWCSITEPVLPPAAKTLMTNSGKYAHYAPGLCQRATRFGSLADCAQAAQTGQAPTHPPLWL